MKNLSIFTFFFVISCNSVFPQEIILNFIPAIDTLNIDSIQVTNVATNMSLTVPGNESVNLNDIITSTNELGLFSENSMIYPNPFQDYTSLQYIATKKETIRLIMINSAGEYATTCNQYLLPGTHHFKITTKSPGIYFINLQSGGRNTSHKLVSLKKGNSDRIEYAGAYGEAVTNKSLKITQTKQVIHFKLYSGNNITIIADSPVESKTYTVEFYECKDADDQNYPIVQVGSQWWMAKNLAYLPSVSPASSVSNTEKHYYVYGYNGIDASIAKATDNFNTYGVLYNWPAIMNGSGSSNDNPSGVRGICPEGWHLPSHAEWTQLENYMIANGFNYDGTTKDNKIAKSLAATILWKEPSLTGDVGTDLSLNNKSGFSALPGGHRYNFASFDALGYLGCWWACTETYPNIAWCRVMTCFYNKSIGETNYKECGFSVRCIKD